ncbi:MAG: hypothetical protein WCW78_03050 [Candidatus Paceibacterota bacterium]|jgi:hypothetical protein
MALSTKQMGFETIKPLSPENPDSETNSATPIQKESETLFGKIRKKTGSIAKGLAVLGALSLTEPGDKQEINEYSPGRTWPPQPTEFAIQMTEEKLSHEEYLKLCEEQPEKAFVTASLYKNEPWLADALIKATKNVPKYALQYADRYKDNQNYNEIISLAIDDIKSAHSKDLAVEYPLDPLYVIGLYPSAWINTPRAHEILEEKLNQGDEGYFIGNFRELSQSTEGYKIGERIIRSKSNSWWVLQYMDQITGWPWTEEVIENAAKQNPRKFLLCAYSTLTRTLPKELRDRLTIEISKKRPDAAISIGWETMAMSETDLVETEDSKEFLDVLKKSGDENLMLVPEIRKLIVDGEISYDKAPEIGMLLNHISSKRITIKEAVDATKNPEYYSQLTREVVKDPNNPAQGLAEKYLAEEELREVHEMNLLHEQSDEKRFASIEQSNPEELYLIIAFGEEEIFTSTFNGVFDRLLTRMTRDHITGEQLLEQANFAKFRTFIRTCTEFNRWNDFLETMAPADRARVSEQFIQGIEKSQDPLREAVSIAEAISATKDPSLLTIFEKEIKQQIDAINVAHKPDIEILYKLIATTFSQKGVKDDWLKNIEKEYHLTSLTEIKSEELFNHDKANIQQYFFYNDEDGHTSFNNFVSQYKNNQKWNIHDHGTFVTITSSHEGRTVELYANKPEAEDAGPKEIEEVFKKRDIQTIMVVHRGHSYHAEETIRQIPSIAKIVSLGSCGGYRNLSEVLERAPNAHIISTKGTGTKFVNDPSLKMLNEEILAGDDIIWSDFWAKAEQKLGGQEKFKDYVPPHKNFGATFIKAYEQATKHTEEH